MNLAALIEKRNALMTQISTLAKNDNLNTEQRSQFDAMAADLEAMNADVQRAERAAAIEQELRAQTRPPRAQPGATTEQSNEAEQRAAFRDYIQKGIISDGVLKRDMTTGAASGGVLVPVGFDPQLSLAVKAAGEVAAAVRFLPTENGSSIKVGFGDLTSNLMVVQGAEGTASTEADVPTSGKTSNVDTLSTYVTVSNQLVQDAYFDIGNFVQTALGEAYAQTMAKFITQGNSSNFESLTVKTPATVTTTAITYDNLVDHFASLDPRYRVGAEYLMSSTQWASLMKLKDSANRPLIQPTLDPAAAPFGSLFGLNIRLSQYADPTKPILLGNWKKAYTWRQAGQLSIARLDQVKALTLETVFLAVVRAGGYSTIQAASPSAVAIAIGS